MILIMKALNLLSLKNIFVRLKRKKLFALMFCYENNLVYPVQISDEKFENGMDLLMIIDALCLY